MTSLLLELLELPGWSLRVRTATTNTCGNDELPHVHRLWELWK